MTDQIGAYKWGVYDQEDQPFPCYRYVITQFDGDNWLWVDSGKGYPDASSAQGAAEAEIDRLKQLNAENGDPSGLVKATRLAVQLVADQLADLDDSLRRRRGRLSALMARLSQHDPNHPLYVKPDGPHWHVRAHADADVEAFPTEFHALDWAADRLEEFADGERDSAVGYEVLHGNAETVKDLLREALDSIARATAWYALADNARKTWEQASAAPFERAPVYASADEAANRTALRSSALWNMGQIEGTRGLAMTFWECADSECAPADE